MSESDPFTATGNFQADPSTPKEPAALPETTGRYRVQRLIGRGGFGLVDLARDTRLDRNVAVKVPHANLVADSDSAASYVNEAKMVAGRDHPNIVPVYDVGSTAEFPCYVVSKYIDGFDGSTRAWRCYLTMRSKSIVSWTVCSRLIP